MNTVKYICKNCSWETSIREEWADLKPKRCMNKRCNTSFIASPESLVVKLPEKIKEEIVVKKRTYAKKRKEASESVE